MKTKTPSRIPAYPLTWPRAVPRTTAQERSKPLFKARDWSQSLKALHQELRRLGAESEIISTNQPIRVDGNPYAQERRIDDPGVAVYFELDGEHLCFPCDRWLTIGYNLRAITLHIEAMRLQQRNGVGTAKQAFTGYKALTANAGEQEDAFEVLAIKRGATADEIHTAHRALARSAHPDFGGSSDQMARINTARDRALAEVQG